MTKENMQIEIDRLTRDAGDLKDEIASLNVVVDDIDASVSRHIDKINELQKDNEILGLKVVELTLELAKAAK